MEKVRDIYLNGSYNPKLSSGSYNIILMDTEDNKDLISKKEYGASVNEILLKGLLEALSRCSNDSEVVVHTNTSLGWGNTKKSKNKGLLEKIKSICKLRNIAIDMREKEDLSFLKDLIRSYSL